MATSPESRRARRLAARAERQRLAEEGRRRARRRRRLTIGAAVALVVIILGVVGFFIVQNATRPLPGRPVADEGRDHVPQGSPITYKHIPPASGPHYPVALRPGVYTEPQPEGNWVHSLEHGYVVILYSCPDGCPDLVQQLRDFYENAPKSGRYGYQKLVVAPYPGLEHRVAAIAWDRIDEMDQFDRERLLTFYRAFLDRGPEDAP